MYQGVSSIIKENEKIESKRYVYTIQKVLNIGFSNTYIATNQLGKEVVVKQFKNKDEKTIQSQKKIFLHVRDIHKNDTDFSKMIEYPLEQFEFAGYFFEIKAKINGENFEEFLFNNKISFAQRLSFASQITKIVFLLHKYDIIHTDLKFEQFMVINKKYIKLIDFSNIIIKDKVSLPAGTNGYKSPEHIQNKKIVKESDIFTLAILIYTTLTYKHPFNDILQFYEEKVLSYKPASLLTIFPDFPYHFSKAIENAFCIDTQKRPTAGQLLGYFKTFRMPFLMADNRKFFIKTFPLKFNPNIAKVILPKFTKFIYNPHFEITQENGEYFIKTSPLPPLSAKKKFFYPKLNGESFKKKKLKDGDVIRIGKIQIQFFERLV